MRYRSRFDLEALVRSALGELDTGELKVTGCTATINGRDPTYQRRLTIH
jgi:hypothetical protein